MEGGREGQCFRMIVIVVVVVAVDPPSTVTTTSKTPTPDTWFLTKITQLRIFAITLDHITFGSSNFHELGSEKFNPVEQ